MNPFLMKKGPKRAAAVRAQGGEYLAMGRGVPKDKKKRAEVKDALVERSQLSGAEAVKQFLEMKKKKFKCGYDSSCAVSTEVSWNQPKLDDKDKDDAVTHSDSKNSRRPMWQRSQKRQTANHQRLLDYLKKTGREYVGADALRLSRAEQAAGIEGPLALEIHCQCLHQCPCPTLGLGCEISWRGESPCLSADSYPRKAFGEIILWNCPFQVH